MGYNALIVAAQQMGQKEIVNLLMKIHGVTEKLEGSLDQVHRPDSSLEE